MRPQRLGQVGQPVAYPADYPAVPKEFDTLPIPTVPPVSVATQEVLDALRVIRDAQEIQRLTQTVRKLSISRTFEVPSSAPGTLPIQILSAAKDKRAYVFTNISNEARLPTSFGTVFSSAARGAGTYLSDTFLLGAWTDLWIWLNITANAGTGRLQINGQQSVTYDTAGQTFTTDLVNIFQGVSAVGAYQIKLHRNDWVDLRIQAIVTTAAVTFEMAVTSKNVIPGNEGGEEDTIYLGASPDVSLETGMPLYALQNRTLYLEELTEIWAINGSLNAGDTSFLRVQELQ